MEKKTKKRKKAELAEAEVQDTNSGDDNFGSQEDGESGKKKRKIQPACAAYYCEHMGYVDQADAAIHRYMPKNRNAKWTLIGFIFLIKLCINNSWILFNWSRSML